MAWKEPKLDWNANPKSPMAEDFNRIEGNIAHVLNEIEAKKGAIVEAVNTKRVTASIENSYQEIADIIRSINLNHRVDSGTASLTQINATSAKLIVTGLPFKPSKIFVRGAAETRIRDSYNNGSYAENWITYDFGVVNGVMCPANKAGQYYIASGPSFVYGISSANMAVSVTYQSNGFEMTITATLGDGTAGLRNYGIQYWFAEE